MKNQYVKAIALLLCIITAHFANAQPCSNVTTYPQQTICQGTSYNFNGVNLTTQGIYNDTIVLSGGCDSIISLQLFVIPIVYTNFYDSICPGQTITFGPYILSATGVFTDTLFDLATGCDSVLVMNLFVYHSGNDTFPISASLCGTGAGGPPASYNFYGRRLTTSGIYYHTGGAVVGGTGPCADSVIKLTLTVGAAPVVIGTVRGGPGGGTIIPDTIRTCASSYNLYGSVKTANGNYNDTIISSIGCDSILAYIYLILNSGFNTATVNGTSCNGNPFVWRGNSYPGPRGFGNATYYDTIPGPGGCDTIYTIVVAAGFRQPTATYTDSFCAGSSFTYDGTTFTTSGTDTVYAPSPALGSCDSMIILHLRYKTAPIFVLRDSFCDGSTYTYRGYTYTDSGAHYFTTTAGPGGGCDSIIEVYLKYKSAPTINIVDSFCQGSSYTYHGYAYTTSGTHSFTITSPSGCDSIFNLRLSYTVMPTRTVTPTICQGQAYTYGDTSFNVTGRFQYIYSPGPGLCDSLINIRLRVTPAPQANYSASFCQGDSFVYAGHSFSAAGIDTVLVPNPAGACDSVIILTLTYRSAVVPVITASIPSHILIVNPSAASYRWYLNGSPIAGDTTQTITPSVNGVYTVVEIPGGTACNGISAPDTVNWVPNGIQNILSSNNFKLYPNPNAGKFTIESDAAQVASGTEILIYNVLGQPVLQTWMTGTKQEIDMTNSGNGTYLVEIRNQQSNKFTHFVISR